MAKRSKQSNSKKRKKPVKKVDGNSYSPQQELLELLKTQCPEVFTEGQIDSKKLKQTLGEEVAADGERYGLSWAGKSDCFRHIQEPTTATLKPAHKESVDFDNTENVFIEGDNLQVLKVLQKSYYGEIKMIYIDPPYNTGNDSFIYPDKFAESQEDYLKRIGDKDVEGNLIKDGFFRKNTKDSGHFHSNWLSMMYPRLFLARNLLSSDGILFVSIDENEAHHLRIIFDEVFGVTSLAGEFIWNTRHSQQQGLISTYHEKILVYTKMDSNLYPNFIFDSDGSEIVAGAMKKISRGNPASDFQFPSGVRCEAPDGTIFSGKWGGKETVELIEGKFVVENGKTKYPMTLRAGWTQKNQMEAFYQGEQPVYDTKGQLVKEFFFTTKGKLKTVKDKSRITPSSILDQFGTVSQATKNLADLLKGDYFERPKPIGLLKYLVQLVCRKDSKSIVCDFFAGSCTLAHSIMELNAEQGGNRKFMCIQLAEPCDPNTASGENAIAAGYKSIADIGKERIRRAAKKIAKENEGKVGFDKGKLDFGFKVFKLSESNFKIWRSDITTTKELEKQMGLFVDNVKAESTQENILFELILKSGLDLNVSVEKKKQNGKQYFIIDKGKLIICLEDKITQKLIDTILKSKPEKVICLDKAFAGNDQLKTNTALQMESANVDFKVI